MAAPFSLSMFQLGMTCPVKAASAETILKGGIMAAENSYHWEEKYNDAILETDNAKLLKRITTAKRPSVPESRNWI